MNSGTKITIGIGALVLLAGIGLTFVGGNSASGLEDFVVEDDRVWTGDSGIYVHEISDEWISPSSPSPKVANAPYSVTLLIVAG